MMSILPSGRASTSSARTGWVRTLWTFPLTLSPATRSGQALSKGERRLSLAMFAWFALLPCLSSLAIADQTTSRGAAIANACATCHGPDGQSQGAIPSLNSLAKENFMAAMRAFRTGERQGTVMNRIAKGLDEADIEAVAAYWGGRPPAAKRLR